jgi:hypothetical protein
VEGAVPEVSFFLKAVQRALRPPPIWTDLGFLRGRDGMSFAVTGIGSKGKSVAAEWSEWSFAVVVAVWRDLGGFWLEGVTETERGRRGLKRIAGPSPLAATG